MTIRTLRLTRFLIYPVFALLFVFFARNDQIIGLVITAIIFVAVLVFLQRSINRRIAEGQVFQTSGGINKAMIYIALGIAVASIVVALYSLFTYQR